jgi:flagellin-like protein
MKWKKKLDEEGVSPVIAIILMVAITVVLAGVLYVWVTSLADTEETVKNLQLKGEISVVDNSTANLVITHRGGDKIAWSDYQVTLHGSTVTTTSTETAVGETATFAYTGALTVGEEYTARIIDVDADKIVWEDVITAKAA